MRILLIMLCVGVLGLFSLAGCGETEGAGGSGGSAGTGGSGGSAGTGGTGGIADIDITPGMWSRWAAGTAVCIFVNEEGTALVPDVSCDMSPGGDAEWAFEYRSNRQDGCAITYPHAADEPKTIPIVDNSFELDVMQGDNAITFSGTFTSETTVSGTASSSAVCPIEGSWSATPGDDL